MRGLKFIKAIILVAVMLLLLDSCSSARSKRGCDGRGKSRVPFGYM